MAKVRTRSISSRLTIMNMLVSSVALLLACAALFAYDQVTFRHDLVRTLSAQARIIASTSVSAVLFDDPQVAERTLSALKSSSNITSACIVGRNSHVLARYSTEGEDGLADRPQLIRGGNEAHRFGNGRVVLVRQIISEGQSIGFVYLRATLQEVDQRLKRYALIAFSVLLVSLLAATLISSTFRKSVAQPIVELAEAAQRISRDKDYTIRVTPMAESTEVATLVGSFNDMLDELHKAHSELEQRVAERTRELVSANRELESFSYSVSHDLRGPLDAINGFTYVLLEQHSPTLDPQTRDLIGNIRSSGKRMTELIDDLLNLSRITTSVIHAVKVDLAALARLIMEELCKGAPERKVDFIVPVDAQAYGDPHLLRIVMENLLRNAWKFTSHHDHARIEFGETIQDSQPVYFVKDDGSGFDPHAAERLFQPFQRLHSTAEFPGNGIGLATVRRIVRRHGGDVWAEGAVEKGAIFNFTLALPPAMAGAST